MTESSAIQTAQDVLGTLIRRDPAYLEQRLTREIIVALAGRAVVAALVTGEPGVLDRLVLELADRADVHFTTVQESAGVITGDESVHEPWVEGSQETIFPDGGFWRNYRCLVEPRLPPTALAELDRSTDRIVDLLGNPSREGIWDRRGLVIGHVQSGKTNNYLGVVTKAADAGYRLIIILAGAHNNLRAQTQHRFDEAFVGRDTRAGLGEAPPAFGVGLLQSQNHVHTMTKATEAGDFKRGFADGAGWNPFNHSNLPTVFVVKKHVTVLQTLHDWLRHNAGLLPGQSTIEDVPLLLIDDEADNASIDTANHINSDTLPTGTNMGIRRILRLFDQSAYVDYTATPFANVFIDANAEHEKLGGDLFPRDFIVGLQAPSNYVGADLIFGTGADADGLPMVSRLLDHEVWIPPNHDVEFVPSDDLTPASLSRALDSFILACAARRLRGQAGASNSMLVHLTRFKLAQNTIGRRLGEMLAERYNDLRYAPDDDPVWERFSDLWEEDFIPNAVALQNHAGPRPPLDDFDSVRPHLAPAVSKIEVRLINGDSDDVLDYDKHPEGLSTIVVGGAKLSRGLTLEGLTVSYYARTTRLYDALMQMGRWFGYRPGYLDLCRVYAPPGVVSHFRNISVATTELLREVKILENTNMTPRQFGLRVRHSPGMFITGSTKMRNTQIRRIGFGAERPETTSLELPAGRRQLAFDCLDAFVTQLTETADADASPGGDNSAWRGVSSAMITAYFDSLAAEDLYPFTTGRPLYLADYIRKRNQHGDLGEWTVLLRSNSQWPGQPQKLANGAVSVGLSTRRDDGRAGRYSFNSLIGSADERFDLTDAELGQARAEAGAENPTGTYLRHARASERGLLILYLLDPNIGYTAEPGPPFAAYCVSFPKDPDGTRVEYRINSVQMEQEINA
ncbi:Z1 domain-containing protein [Ilumatobacter sp.]|uniref:Z1 domain-containing protein n=1 Tax=Ilumatobacter sp. TaxID=1967498 RepID=UPI0037531F55